MAPVMMCPCQSGLPARRDHTGAVRCPCCQAARRMHGKNVRVDVEASRETITRMAVARRKIQTMCEALDALA